MLNDIEQNYKLKRSIILSITLHCVLITVLIWSSIHQPQEFNVNNNKSSIDAVIIDPEATMQQYIYKHQQTDVQLIQQKHDEQAQQQTKELQKKQLAEQQHLKTFEKHFPVMLEAAEAQKHNQVEAKKQAEVKTKKAAAQAKANQATKNKVNATKKITAQVAKQSDNIDSLLGSLTEAKNTLKVGGTTAWTSKFKKNGTKVTEIDAYKTQVSRAISNKFYNASSYSGRTCDLRIKLAPDGLLISVTAISGDLWLCKAAVSAANLATIPRPPNQQVYKAFKNATLRFSPQ